jgi:hypothetical protein
VASAEAALRLSGANPEIHAAAAYVYGRAGEQQKAGTLLERLVALAQSRYVSASLLAQAGISVCEVTTTLDRLEQAYEQRAADSGVDCRSPALQHAAIGIHGSAHSVSGWACRPARDSAARVIHARRDVTCLDVFAD